MTHHRHRRNGSFLSSNAQDFIEETNNPTVPTGHLIPEQ